MENVLMPGEIEMYIDTIQKLEMKELGSPKWIDWHERVQKLNQQALIEASQLREEHVKECLVSFGKLRLLIREAILINIWKYKVLPILLKLEPEPESTFLAYTILYHEAVCVSLLEISMYHSSVCEALEDSSIDLLDYACGTASQLLSLKHVDTKKNETATEEMLRQRDNISFEIGIRSLAIIRYLSENLQTLPISITTKVFNTNDVPSLFAQLLFIKPWIANNKQFSGGKWRDWDNEKLSQTEAQVWLTLRQLLLDPECPKNYQFTEGRRTHLVKLIPLLSPVLLDQLAPLIELKHFLCRLSVAEKPELNSRPFLLEVVAQIKQDILKETGKKWRTIAERQLDVVFCSDKEQLKETASKLSQAYNMDLLEKFEGDEKSECRQCGKEAVQRCSRCKKAWYCSRSCQVDNWQEHKEVCIEAN